METSLAQSPENRQIGRFLLLAAVLSALPMALHLAGVDFGFRSGAGAAAGFSGPGEDLIQAVHGALARRMFHTFLEWVTVTLATTTFLLAVVHFGIRQEITTPLLGLALLGSGVMDALHVLAADQFFPGVLGDADVSSVTWSISRAYKALVLIACVACLLRGRPHRRAAAAIAGAILVSLALGAAALLWVSITAVPLPATLFPDAAVPRPYDQALLALFLAAGLYFYPRFYARYPSVFSAMLVASAIPELAAQAHAAYGSREYFDSHFTMAHLAKALAYLLPFVGLCLEYVKPNRDLKRAMAAYREAEQALNESQAKYQTIHDTVLEGIITIDEDGTMRSVNPFAERTFGYSMAELVGRNVSMLMPEHDASRHDQYLRNYLSTGIAKVIGTGREVTGQRKDGTQFPLELSVCEMRLGERRMFTGTLRDISERKEIERMKAEFISTVSHELRTPLASIVGYADVLLDGEAGAVSEKQVECLKVIVRNGMRLNGLIGDLLDIERIEQGQLALHARPLDLSELLTLVALTFKVSADRKGLELRMALPPGLVVPGDPDRLTQVFSNLLSNAIKYTRRGGVQVETESRPGRVAVTVSDSGVGMTPETLKHLFTKFFRADDPYTRDAGGTGLGLVIAKAIVEQHGGRIEVGSTPGKGSWFRVELPAVEAVQPAPGNREAARGEVPPDPPDGERDSSRWFEPQPS